MRPDAVATTGTEEFLGELCWRVRLHKAKQSGDIEKQDAFFSKNSGLLIGNRKGSAVVSYDDWKPLGTLILYRKIRITSPDESLVMYIEEIELNNVPESLFAIPF